MLLSYCHVGIKGLLSSLLYDGKYRITASRIHLYVKIRHMGVFLPLLIFAKQTQSSYLVTIDVQHGGCIIFCTFGSAYSFDSPLIDDIVICKNRNKNKKDCCMSLILVNYIKR